MLNLIDTHCHLTAIETADLPQALARAEAAGVTRFVAIGASDGTKSAKDTLEIAQNFSEVRASVGIHPHDAGKGHQLSELEALLAHPLVVAVGETGLDYFRAWSPFEDQRSLFRETIALARNVHKPLIIHCRDAADDVYDILKAESAEEIGGVFHCYAEDAAYAEKLRDLNFLVSFTGNITFKKAVPLRETLRAIPIKQIMLETDCPYMAPEPFRGKPSEPMHIYQIAKRVAEVKELSIEEVAQETTDTALQFFKWDQT